MPSLREASETITLTVEQGWKRALQRQFLIDDAQNPAGARIGDDDRPVIGAESIDRRLADDEIFAINVVADGGIGVGRLGPGIKENSSSARGA